MELPTRKQNRLKEYDYSTPNAYFITICTEKRKNLFWMDVGAIIDRPKNVPLTNLGIIAQRSIENIPKYYPAISVDHYVIMPNHIHLLLQINTDVNGRSMIAPTISTVVRLMKGTVYQTHLSIHNPAVKKYPLSFYRKWVRSGISRPLYCIHESFL